MRDVPKPLEEAADERQIFMPYFLFQWNPDARRTTARGQGGVVVRWYMLEKSKQLTAMQRMFLAQATTQPLSFYEVVWNEPGERMRVWDVLVGGETEVIERSGSRHLRQGDLLFAQIWHQPELAVFGSMAPICIPPDKKIEVIELRKTLKKRIAKQNRYLAPHDLLRYADLIRATYLDIRDRLFAPPVLCNTDGDPLLFHTLTFRFRPQRQSEMLSIPGHMEAVLNGDLKHPQVVTWSMIEQILLTNPIDDMLVAESKPAASGEKKQDKQTANQDWLEKKGVPDLLIIDFWSPEISYESDSYDKNGEEHHPITPCPCHKDEDFHEHSHKRDCEIIVFSDGGIGISCFSRDFGLKQVIKKMNEIKGEKYSHLIFEEPDPVEEALDFGAVADECTPCIHFGESSYAHTREESLPKMY
jgi:hypothetical protein